MKDAHGNVTPSGKTENGITIYDAQIGDTLADGKGGIVGYVSAFVIESSYPDYVLIYEHGSRQDFIVRQGEGPQYYSVPSTKWLGVAPRTLERIAAIA